MVAYEVEYNDLGGLFKMTTYRKIDFFMIACEVENNDVDIF